MKECVIILAVIILVTITSIWSEKYLEKTSNSLISELDELKNLLQDEREADAQSLLAQNIYTKWQDLRNNWSLLTTHEELDTIELSILGMKAGIEKESNDTALTELEKSKFLIGHIKEKENFKLKNIF